MPKIKTLLLDSKTIRTLVTMKDAVRAIEKPQHMQSVVMHIITGHDPIDWKTLKIAPDYYE